MKFFHKRIKAKKVGILSKKLSNQVEDVLLGQSKNVLEKHKNRNKKKENMEQKTKGISLRFQLTMGFLVPVICIILLGFISYAKASEKIIKNFEKSTIATINTTGEYYSLILKSVEDKSLQILNDAVIKQYYSGYYKKNGNQESETLSSIRTNIVAMATADSIVENIAIITSYGKEAVSYGSFIQDKLETPYESFRKSDEANLVLTSGKNCIWVGYHPFFDEGLGISTNQYGITLLREYKDSAGKSIGFIMIDVNKSILQNVIKQLALPKGSSFAFISPDGREVTEKEDSEYPIFTDKQFYLDSLASEETNGFDYVHINGKEYLYAYTKIKDTGVLACSLIPASHLYNQADVIKRITLFVVSIASLIAIATGLFFSSNISVAIKSIIEKLSLAAKGDLTIHIDTKRKDEFGNLANSVNHMIHNMKELIEKATNINHKVLDSTQEVASSSEIMLESSKNISKAIHDIQGGVTEQAEDTEKCLQQTNDLSERINRVYTNAGEMDGITSTTKNIIKDGIVIIDDLNHKTKATAKINQATIRDIEELELESKSIVSIIKVITEIADQTNLLALNANIEAARAGAAGRGFAVVADEIRKLAEGSSEAANKITQIIGHIQSKTQTTVHSVKQTEEIITSQNEALYNTVQAFENINSHVEGLMNMLHKISTEINDIETVKTTTLNAIMNISAISEETAAASEEVETTAQDQLKSVTNLNHAAQELNNNVKLLDEAISVFRI
jgi:methyl-accepting chemotaxis protein